ncbi:MAG: insulinase family protein [Clostridia bacterium]|nr:insulinase family protein [Clostridia bacterium]
MNIKLKNGLRIVGEKMPHVRSVAVGVWVGVGSRAETAAENGISHYMEHMLFKGTERRTAAQIASEMDAIGGNLNAYTTREYTCYYAKSVDEDVETVFDILSDMYTSSSLGEAETELERGVILEEISMYEDSPEDVAQETLAKLVFGSDPLGYGIAGTRETVLGITSGDLRAFMTKYYTAKNTVIALAGNFDEEKIRYLCEKYFGTVPEGFSYTDYGTAPFCAGETEKQKDIEQTHIAIALPGIAQNSEERYVMSALCGAFGGGMSSRLFQKIREEKGLAYSIYASPEGFKNAGILNIYAGVSPENADLVCELIQKEMQDILKNGLTEEEFLRSKSQMRASYIMGQESVSGRMQVLGRNMLLYNKIQKAEDVLSGIESVSRREAEKLAERLFASEWAKACVCPKP